MEIEIDSTETLLNLLFSFVFILQIKKFDKNLMK